MGRGDREYDRQPRRVMLEKLLRTCPLRIFAVVVLNGVSAYAYLVITFDYRERIEQVD